MELLSQHQPFKEENKSNAEHDPRAKGTERPSNTNARKSFKG